MLGMGMGLSINMDQEDKKITIQEHGYICKYCGERHVSDDTETWCGIAQSAKEQKNV